ncbi:hypothetical protein K3495_g2934 [Podosphaera aphanis]|nr:hypothetical protein K3495_g2934 [Podosphaera aphanis]
MTRLQRVFRQLPLSSENAESLLAPAYFRTKKTEIEGIEDYLNWSRTITPSDICTFSDGSSEGHGRSSWGFALQLGGITFNKDQEILHGRKVYDAKIVGATMALRAALSMGQDGEKIFVLLHNQSAVRAVQTG